MKRAVKFCKRGGYFLKSDIEKFFASMDHAVLKNMLVKKIKDERLLELLFVIVDHPYPGQNAGKGVPIGNLTSQWFANLYLDALDHLVTQLGRGSKRRAGLSGAAAGATTPGIAVLRIATGTRRAIATRIWVSAS